MKGVSSKEVCQRKQFYPCLNHGFLKILYKRRSSEIYVIDNFVCPYYMGNQGSAGENVFTKDPVQDITASEKDTIQ